MAFRLIEVAERFGVARQTVHWWMARYRDGGIDGLADRSRAPKAHPWQVSMEVEAVICALRGSPRITRVGGLNASCAGRLGLLVSFH